MIDKAEAQRLGVSTIESKNTIENKNTQLIEKLKALLPNVINSDNQLDVKALQDAVDSTQTTSNNQGYELTFAGKGLARAEATRPTTKELTVQHKQSKQFDTTKNVVIRGDNIDALKILSENYSNKIKMIYIDPPYNTRSENFIYKDNFKKNEETLIEEYQLGEETSNFLHNVYGTQSHSGWLAFMYPRLKLARDLLTDDGVIFISIDDNEQANLKIMCDELFGESKTDYFIWRKSGAGRDGKMKNTTTFRKDHEYVLVAFKNEAYLNKSFEKPNWQNKYPNLDNDIRGNYKAGCISKKEEASNINHKNYYKVISPSGKEFIRQFDISKEEFEKLDKDNRIYWGIDKNSVPSIKIFENEKRKTNTSSLFLSSGTSTEGKKEVAEFFNNLEIFSNPKPTALIQKILQLSTTSNDIILDFFAGSGTTGDAVMQLNAEDGGNRKFILVQLDEKINEKSNKEAHDFCTQHGLEPVISSICIERLNRAGENIHKHAEKHGLEASTNTLDIGYKVFTLTEKPHIEQENFIFKISNPRTSTYNTLYNMISATCKTLDTPIEELIPNTLYACDEELYLLDNIDAQELEKYPDKKINIDGYASINLENFLNMGIATSETTTVLW